MHNITLINGDGIGPEISDAVVRIIEASGLKINWDVQTAGEDVIEKEGVPLPERVLESIRKNKVALKAPVTTPIGKGFRSLNVTLRKKYDLYANIRPAKSNNAVKTAFKDIDLIVFRENTEDLYVGVEEQIDENTVHATKIITRHASERIIKDAFEYAKAHNRKKVTCVHKANILKMSDGLFLSIFYDIAKNYPEIEANDKIVDNTCMQLVMNPQQFDIMVMPNLYGDIVSDLTSGLIGGLGLLPSSNLGKDYAMFEAVHGSAPDIAGKHIANPTALLWSACMMLEYLGQNDVASKIRNAVDAVLNEGTTLTPDLHGTATTEAYCDAIIAKL